ncbi:Patatin-like protein 3, partial [Mucuna pruriens]
ALVAVSEVIQHNKGKNITLLSLGTGTVQTQKKLNGIFESVCELTWLVTHSGVVGEALYGTDMIHYYLATVFPGVLPADNYIRIEAYNLDSSMEAMDNAEIKNMDNLEEVGKKLLEQNVFRINVNTFYPAALDQTNAQALDRCVH